MTTCPTCHTPIVLQATVPAWRQPADWTAFYGDPAATRAIRCQTAGYVHFCVLVEGKESHRLAILRGEVYDI